jgi:beta-galactosidase
VHIESSVVNESRTSQHVTARSRSSDCSRRDRRPADLSPQGQTIAPGGKARLSGECPVPNPKLWDIDHPWLYRVQVSVKSSPDLKSSGPITDDEQVPLGIREFHFDAATGFWLNGRNFKIKGVAIHSDGGAVGIAVPDSVWERRLSALRALGVNAIRTAHNPPSPAVSRPL